MQRYLDWFCWFVVIGLWLSVVTVFYLFYKFSVGPTAKGPFSLAKTLLVALWQVLWDMARGR